MSCFGTPFLYWDHKNILPDFLHNIFRFHILLLHLLHLEFYFLCILWWGASGREPTCQCRRHKRHGFDPWIVKFSWRKAWQPTPTPVFLLGESHGQRSLVAYTPQSHKRVRHTKVTEHAYTHEVKCKFCWQFVETMMERWWGPRLFEEWLLFLQWMNEGMVKMRMLRCKGNIQHDGYS